jgi:hypothetical protein
MRSFKDRCLLFRGLIVRLLDVVFKTVDKVELRSVFVFGHPDYFWANIFYENIPTTIPHVSKYMEVLLGNLSLSSVYFSRDLDLYGLPPNI